jgi:dipeptidase D
VAAAMAVLEAKDLVHGPVEALITMDEETGMTGAENLKAGVLDGDILINLDSEDEGELYIGCAGGIDTTGEFTYTPESVPEGMAAYKISVKGLRGGHSGLDINLGRGNANKIMNVLLMKAAEKYGVRLANIDGGSLRNAIPRESFATVVVEEDKKDVFETFVKEFEVIAQEEFAEADGGLMIIAETAEMPENLLDLTTQANLYKAVLECPNGVMKMSESVKGIVETSTNLAIVKSENGKIVLASLQRSLIDDDKDKLGETIRKVFEGAGAKAESSGSYPGWKPNPDSAILKEMKEVYNKRFGRVPEVKVIHAGLECGILGATYTNWDMISFGPTIRNPHSPDEKVNIATVDLFWEFLIETLKHAPKK